MKKATFVIIPVFIIILFFPAYFFAQDIKDYLSFQFYFQDYYGNWSYMSFWAKNTYGNYVWNYESGVVGGFLEMNAGICWRHFLSERVFGELSLMSGVYSLEKSPIYRYLNTVFERYRIPPLEYIAQAGLGYCFFKSGGTKVFLEISGSMSATRAWANGLKFQRQEWRDPYLSWRGEIGAIIDLKKKWFIEGSVGLFSNSNDYLRSGHQVRIGVGKYFD